MLSVTVVVTQPPDTGEKGKRKKTKSSRRFTDVHPHTYKATHALSLFAFVVVIVVSSLNVVVAVVVVVATIPRLTLI